MVVDLAVDGQRNGVVFVGDGLATGVNANDGETLVDEDGVVCDLVARPSDRLAILENYVAVSEIIADFFPERTNLGPCVSPAFPYGSRLGETFVHRDVYTTVSRARVCVGRALYWWQAKMPHILPAVCLSVWCEGGSECAGTADEVVLLD